MTDERTPAEATAVADTDAEVADTADGVDSGVDSGVAESAPTSPVEIARQLEALLIVADEPQSLVSLATAVSAPVAAVRQAVESLVSDYDGETGGPRRGFELREVAGGWRIYVRAEHDALIADLIGGSTPSRLSQAALETLAVIAYKQPVTRGQVAAIRAVNVDSVVRTLLGRGLIAEAFADADTGAIHYQTTDELLVHLGINSLDDLPPISPLLEDGADGFDGEEAR